MKFYHTLLCKISDDFIKKANLIFVTFKMSKVTEVITLGLFLASVLQRGFCSHLSKQDKTLLNEVSKNIPLAECDMIIVSSEPFQGETHETGVFSI